MASTKQKQAQARARRQANKPEFRIDEEKFLNVLSKLVTVIMNRDPNQDYGQTQNMSDAAEAIVSEKRLNATDLQQLLSLRERADRTLKQMYGCALSTGLTAIATDPEELLKRHNVPQDIRVATGLLDLIVARLALRLGAVKFSVIVP